MTYSLNRRFFLKFTSIAAAASVFRAPFAAAQAERLRLIFWGGQDRADRTNKAGDVFAAKTNISVESEFLSWNDYWPKLATQIAGGNASDIVQMDYRYIVEYAKRNAIAPLDEFVGKELLLEDFDKDQIAGGSVGGKLYGVSLGANSSALIINKAVFEEAGIEAPGNELTFDDLHGFAEKFKSKNVRGGMKVTADSSGLEPAFENWLRQRKKSLYTTDGKLAFDEADGAEWFKLWAALRDAGVCAGAEDQALDTGSIESSMLVIGKAAMISSNSNLLIAHQGLVKDKLSLGACPRIAPGSGGGHYRKPAMLFSIAASSQNKADAAKYISFMVNDQDAAKAVSTERGIPCSAAIRDFLAPTLGDEKKSMLEFVANLGDLLGPIPPSPPSAAGEIELSILRTLSQEVAFGQKTPDEAGSELVSQANDLLSRG